MSMFGSRSTITRLVLFPMLIVMVLVVADLGQAGVSTQEDPKAVPDCCELTTEAVVITRGKTARLELSNKGKAAALVSIQFVDAQGKLLSARQATVNPGKTEASDYLHAGGANRIELRAQFGTREKKTIGLLRPVLRILDNTTGKTVRILGPEQFKKK